jgi:hypothetical protein
MGFLDGLFGRGSSAPTPKQIEAQVHVLQRRHGDPTLRFAAADQLAKWRTPEAIYGLLLRFAVNVASETSDEEEKAHVAALVTDEIGAAAIEPIEKYLRREDLVSWPLRLLGRIVPPEDFRARVLRILSSLDTHFDQHPERKVEIIHGLMDQSQHPEVPDAMTRFLEDTDDTVRLAAAELLTRSARPQDLEALVICVLESQDRPRVKGQLLDMLVGRKLALGERRDEFVKALPPGLGLSLDGALVKQERMSSPARKT